MTSIVTKRSNLILRDVRIHTYTNALCLGMTKIIVITSEFYYVLTDTIVNSPVLVTDHINSKFARVTFIAWSFSQGGRLTDVHSNRLDIVK